MTTAPTIEPTTSIDHVLEAVDRLAPTIRARAAEMEAAREIPVDVLDDLIAAGAFRTLLPASHGGVGAELPDVLRLFEALAVADASTAWTVMIGGGSWFDLLGLPRASFDQLFEDGDTIIAGVFSPSGSLTASGDHYRVSGRWAFASGCRHARWLFGNCVEAMTEDGPVLRIAVFRPDQVAIEDTWTVSGLAATGSHHFRAVDAEVPAAMTATLFDHEPCLDIPLARITPPALFSVCIASVAVGIAQGALDDITVLAGDKVPLLAAGTLVENPLFQYDLAVADTDLRAARALLRETAESVWQSAVDGATPDAQEHARMRAAGVWIAERAAAVTQVAYRHGGGTSLYASSPLQRRLRDVNAVTQHFVVRRDTMTTAGAFLAGLQPQVMVF
jgi:alkylation response protein AidB-like acyl-CoA dehydrogenase